MSEMPQSGWEITDASEPALLLKQKLTGPPTPIPSAVQRNLICQTELFGEALFCEGILQSTAKDEQIQHEMLVHSLLAGLPQRKRVLILGGAEGCTLREVLKYKDVEAVVMVDWDEALCDYFKVSGSIQWNQGAQQDDRVRLVHRDALEFMATMSFAADLTKKELFDAILVDLFDPNTNVRWFVDLLRECQKCLSPTGGIIVNAGPVPLTWQQEYPLRVIAQEMRKLFNLPNYQRQAHHIQVPSFAGEWCFLSAGPRSWNQNLHKSIADLKLGVNIQRWSVAETLRSTAWPIDTPLFLQDFWKPDQSVFDKGTPVKNWRPQPAEKLPGEYYGC